MAELAFIVAGDILEKLGSVALDEIWLALGMKNHLKKLEDTISTVKAVLMDAAEKQKHNREISVWLDHLKYAFFDAEDVLDEFECRILSSRIHNSKARIVKVRRFFSLSNPIAFRFVFSRKIKAIRDRLDEIASNRGKFHLGERAAPERSSKITHSFVRASEVVGRELDREKIVVRLLHSWNRDAAAISVLPIVGIGGLGKTTVAKLVYNDARVDKAFELKMWVCVSDDFDLCRLVKEMLDSATGKSSGVDLSIDQMQAKLRESLKDKRFLLVLDDVWNSDREKWLELRDLLMDGSRGSKIVVTTRNNSVADTMGTVERYRLEGLSLANSLELFVKCAFEQGKEKYYPNLMKIGKQIVNKCKGVPLAVRALGSQLYLESSQFEWEFVRDSEIWELEAKGDSILEVLKLSYYALPSYLKQPFLYCSLFPKGHKIYAFDLISIWNALGLVHSNGSNKKSNRSLEHVVELYIQMLMSRAFLEPGPCLSFQMHDLIHDLALSVAQDDISLINRDTKSAPETARHLSILYDGENNVCHEAPAFLEKLTRVRTVIFPSVGVGPSDKSFIFKHLPRLKYLRLLDLSDSTFEDLPSYVGEMKHLRCLTLSRNRNLKGLPNSICKLHSLQTLRLDGCETLRGLPRDVESLVSLRFLSITTAEALFPENGIPNLTSLQTLIITSCRSLKCLPTKLVQMTALQSLMIGGCRKLCSMENEGARGTNQLSLGVLTLIDLPVLKTLPSWLLGCANTLQRLNIEHCGNLELPKWLTKMSCLKKGTIDDFPINKDLLLPIFSTHQSGYIRLV